MTIVAARVAKELPIAIYQLEWSASSKLSIRGSEIINRSKSSNLQLGNGRDDWRFWLEVRQVHGSGEQQQRWRDVLLQVQVQPLHREEHQSDGGRWLHIEGFNLLIQVIPACNKSAICTIFLSKHPTYVEVERLLK